MLIRVGLETFGEGRSLAWGLDFPGCFANGSDEAEAILRFAGNLLDFERWVALHIDEPWFRLADVDFRIVETYQSSALPGQCEATSAFFEDDLRPLSRQEIENALHVFRWQREELLAGLEFLSVGLPGLETQDWSAAPDALERIARTEHAYLGNLIQGLPPYPEAMDPFEALQFSRELVERSLPGMAEKTQVVERNGERWSSRKLARRLLWQQRVQIDNIKEQLGLKGT
ncbi:MAG: hypothetical protein AAGU04_02020 [Anaerolineaceae bacterium]